LWAVAGELRCELAVGKLKVMRPFGSELPVEQARDTATLVVGPRMYVVFADTSVEQAKQILGAARGIR
jgi:hypothetical protein